MAHVSPSSIFSPSAARQQLATAKDWNYIDGWLTARFNGKSAPPFERNADTLRVLLALAALNETADEDYELLSKAESKAVLEIQTKVVGEKIFRLIEENLTREGHASIDTLSFTAVALNQPFADTEQLAQRILDFQVASFSLDQSSNRVAILQRHLKSELDRVTDLIQELRGDVYRSSSDKQALDHQRNMKVLTASVNELQNRFNSLSAAVGSPKPLIGDVKTEEEKFMALMATVNELEAEAKSYHGLPHDTDLARLELEQLRTELFDLTKKRDTVFEGLVERESPNKYKSRRP